MARDDQDPIFSYDIPVRWGDMDAFGHVNNTLYLRYCEEVRFQLLAAKGIEISPTSYPVVVTVGCTFYTPVFHPDTLRIDCYLSEPGRSSFLIEFDIFSQKKPGKPVARAHSKVVWVDAEGKSQALPDVVRAWF